MTAKIGLISILLAAAAFCCSPADRGGGDGEGDADADTDGDSDSDSDDPVGEECDPGEVWCFENWVAQCDEDGQGWIKLEDCGEQGLLCAAGECEEISTECAVAINQRSYIGCEYWGVTLANGVDPLSFFYSIAIANAGQDQAEVEISDGDSINHSYDVEPGDLKVVTLPWKSAIKSPRDVDTLEHATRKVANAAYHIVSDRPVTVYQFSPLHYMHDPGYTEPIYSYTNDASLLLPVHVYRDEYIAVSRATLKVQDYSSTVSSNPGYVAVVGPKDGATTIEITTSSHTEASDDVSIVPYDAHSPGDTFQVTVEPYEVFQLLSASEPGCTGGTSCASYYTCCDTPPDYDLTGTEIRVVDGPKPAVFSGTECSFVPYDKWACDHLEQQMFPRETWGSSYICAHSETQAAGEPTVWRVLSGSDGNEIAFSPSEVHPGVTLDRGEFVEFESQADFSIEGTGRVAVAQFMVGQNYTSDTTPPENGDPAMALAVPVEQYRESYTFLTPDTYVINYLTIVHHSGVYPELDGEPVLGSGYTVEIDGEWAKTNMEIEAGAHYIESDEPFSIMVYGVGSYTSYMYPGGLDLSKVDVLVE